LSGFTRFKILSFNAKVSLRLEKNEFKNLVTCPDPDPQQKLWIASPSFRIRVKNIPDTEHKFLHWQGGDGTAGADQL
jgi:hypothetical protein